MSRKFIFYKNIFINILHSIRMSIRKISFILFLIYTINFDTKKLLTDKWKNLIAKITLNIFSQTLVKRF